ncbi:MAG: ABC transporter ATP-binding protein [Oscillospiraceae bacterium]|nr:ABC transporter ATP-binding protein [Oscillospiraceae bacterium]
MDLLAVQGITKRYSSFTLQDISFSLPQGKIMGFIGKNGAGKTTTLKSILNMVKLDAGTTQMFGLNYYENEQRCKQEIGVVLGEIDFYKQKKLFSITDVTKRFYRAWDDTAYCKYMDAFALDPQKRVKELSSGMKVKYMLALALSHHAKLFILDEPTSGLDPVSRNDLLGLFRQLVKSGERSILFSTHITTDLEKCADLVTYIKDGKLLKSAETTEFIESFSFLKTLGETAPLSIDEIMVRTEKVIYDV